MSAKEYNEKYLNDGYAPPKPYKPEADRLYPLCDSLTPGSSVEHRLCEPIQQATILPESASTKFAQYPLHREATAKKDYTTAMSNKIFATSFQGDPDEGNMLPSIAEIYNNRRGNGHLYHRSARQ